MNRESMQELYNRMIKEREEMLPRYLDVMYKYFPEKMCTPYERFKNDGGRFGSPSFCEDYSEEDWQKEWKEYQEDEYHFAKYEYEEDYRDPQSGDFYECFSYDMIWNEKKKIPEAEFIYDFYNVMTIYSKCKMCIEDPEIDEYYDTKGLNFEHEDVLITDPGYIIREDSNDDWGKCECGDNFEVLGITKYETRSTLYGDWGCSVYNNDTKEKIGEFCADGGMVSVFSLAEVKKYNPDIEKWCEEHSWCATIIRDFTGIVQIKTGFYDKSQKDYEFYRYVEGIGSINFISCQTGL